MLRRMKKETKKEVKKEKVLNLYQRIQKVISETGFVLKNGRNSIQKYDYVQESDVVNALRGAMSKYGVVMISTLKGARWLDPVSTTGSEEEMPRVRVDMIYKFLNADNPEEFVEVLVPGEGMDSGDKAIKKAVTASRKYALSLTFLLPTGDDPEVDEKVDAEVKEMR